LEGGEGFVLKNGSNGFEVSADGKTYIPAASVALDGNELTILAEQPFQFVRYGVIYYTNETDFSKHITVYNTEGNPLDQFILEIP